MEVTAMLKNNRVNFIISLVIAIALWAYVNGETNPQTTKTFKNIPITFDNEQTLTDEELAVLSTSADSLSVTLSGSRKNVSTVTSSEITATVNLADADNGDNSLKITVTVPEDVQVDSTSLARVDVAVEKLLSKSVDVTVRYSGKFNEDSEPLTVDTSRNSVTVSGAESLVNKVSAVTATIDSSKVTDKMKRLEGVLYAVDSSGNAVNGVNLSAKTVKVSTVLAMVKTVTLDVPVTDDTSDSVDRTYSAPKTITIKGKAADVADIDSITAEDIDISNVTKDSSITIVPILPDGVEVSNKSQSLKLKVTVAELSSQTFTFSAADVETSGQDDTLDASVNTDEITVTVTGKADNISNITEGDFTLSCDLSDLSAGKHSVNLDVSCSGTYIKMTTSPQKVSVTLTDNN
jgi:Uncharacterized protein conserved in bacteria